MRGSQQEVMSIETTLTYTVLGILFIVVHPIDAVSNLGQVRLPHVALVSQGRF